MKNVNILTRRIFEIKGSIVASFILFLGLCSSQVLSAQCTCNTTIGSNPPGTINLAVGQITCVGSGTNLQNSEITGAGTLCIKPGQNVGTIKKIGNGVTVNNYGTVTIKDLNASTGNTNEVNNLGSGSISIDEVNSSGLSTVNGLATFNNVKGSGTLVVNDNTTISTFQGTGTLDLFGRTTITGMNASNGQTLNNNNGARTVINALNPNGIASFNNFEGGHLTIKAGTVGNSAFFNEDTLIFTNALSTSTGSSITNNGWIYISGGQFNPTGTVINNGWLRSEDFMNINGGSKITNNCWFITDDAFNNNSSELINNGGIWVENSGKTWTNNSGEIKLGPESIIYSRGDFINSASIILLDPAEPGADFYVGKSSLNNGPFGNPGDVFNFFDNTGTNFDVANTSPGSGVTFNAIPEPDTTSFASTCSARITSDDPPTIDLDENNVTATGSSYKGTFTEGGGSVPIAEIVNVTDATDSIKSATITITNPGNGTSDRLLFASGLVPSTISVSQVVVGSLHSYALTSISGLAHVSDYEQAIEAFRFAVWSQNPNETDRTIEVTVVNGINKSATAIATLCVVGVNDDPDAIDDAIILLEGGTQDTLTTGEISVLVNDTDLENDALTVVSVLNDVDNGILTLNTDGTFIYVHDGSETTSDLFTYIISDGNGGADTATVTITIVPVNDLPVGAKDSLVVNEGGTQILLEPGNTSVLDNDTDAEGSTLNATLVTDVDHGTLTLNLDGTFEYIHDGSETIIDDFTYRVNDGTDNGNIVTVCIRIVPINDAPIGVKDSLNVDEGGTQIILVTGGGNTSVLDNDTDAEGSTLNATLGTTVKNGALTLNSDGTFEYIHNGSETLVDSFTYVVNDGSIDGNTITVCISINPINDVPIALADTIIVNEGGTQTILKTGETSVLANDSDGDGDDLDAIKLTDPDHTLNDVFTFDEETGTFSYTHDGSETTSDEFTYRVNDGTINGNTVTVVVIIVPVNDNPVAVNDTNRLCEGDVSVTDAGAESSGTIISNDSDVDLDPVEVSTVEGGSSPTVGTYGTLTWNADGTYTYALNLVTTEPLKKDEEVEDVFDYTIIDNNGGTASAQVVIVITGKNDDIVAVDDNNSLNEGDGPVDETNGNGPLIQNDTDPDGDVITVTSIDGDNTGTVTGTFGTLTWNADGTYTYTLDNNAVDSLLIGEVVTDTYTYTVTDGTTSVTADLVITITGTNDDPVANDDTNQMSESTDNVTDADGSGTLLQNDTDPDGPTPGGLNPDVLTVVSIDGTLTGVGTVTGTYGTLTWNADGTYTYDLDNANPLVSGLAAGESLTETFAYITSDGSGATDGANLIITINGGNSNPNATPDVNSLFEDDVSVSNTALADGTGPMLENDLDVDVSDVLTVSEVEGSVSKTTNGLYGTLTWDSDGTYTYTLNNLLLVVQQLAVGETLMDVFTYTAVDGNGGTASSTLTITINGRNDNPSANPDVNTMTEGDGSITDADATPIGTGNLVEDDTDVDGTDVLSVTEVDGDASGSVGGTYGTLIWLSNGSYTYVENDVATQPLEEGEVVTEVFIYTITDGNGEVASSTLTITITGVNDAPVATADSIVVCEGGDTTLLQTGETSVLFNDQDNEGDVLSLDLGTNVTNGTLTLNPDGTFLYEHNGSETTTDFFTYIVKDGTVDGNEVRVDIRVIPKNDNPTALPDSNKIVEGLFSIVESDGLTTKNILDNDDDVDLGAVLEVATVEGSVVQITNGVYGRLEWSKDGTYTYFLDNDAVDSLTQGELVFDVFNYTNTDNEGGTAASTLTICISGVNDVPVAIKDTNRICEGDAPISEVNGNGTLVSNDLDGDFEIRTVTEIGGVLTSTGTIGGTYGTLTWNADGTYIYTLNNDAVDSLQLNEEVLETFNYTITDGLAFSNADLEIKIIGKNDNPIAVNDTNYITEVTDFVRDDNPAGTGTLLDHDTDIDDDDILFVDNIDGSVADTIIGTYGILTWSSVDGSYLYDLDNTLGVVDSLAVGETLVDSFLYVVNDGNTGTDDAYLYIFISGTNEDPRALDDANTIYEDTVSVTGDVLINDTDKDGSDVLVVIDVDGETTTSVETTYGRIDWNTDGSYTYYLNNDDTVNIQSLSQGQEIADTITYIVSDGNGGTDNAELVITIIGVNDTPEAVNDTVTISDDTEVLTIDDETAGVLGNDIDIDQLDQLIVESVGVGTSPGGTGGTVSGTYGILTWNADGTYTYDLETSSPDVVALAEGETLEEVFNYTAFDSYPDGRDNAFLVIIINGGNQAPTAESDTLCLKEGDGATNGLTALLDNDNDQDGSDEIKVTEVNGNLTGEFTGEFGTLTWDVDGNYTYTLNNALDTIIGLGIGDTITERFPYEITDDKETVSSFLLIQIKGINNAPDANPDVNSIIEDEDTVANSTLTDGTGPLLSNDGDIDKSDTISVISVETETDFSVEGSYGTLTWDASGNYTYTLNNSHDEVQGLNNGETLTDVFNYTIADDNGETDLSTLTITINGRNDNPVIVDTLGGTAIDTICVTMDELTTKDTTLFADDVDDNQSVLTWSIITSDPENSDLGTASIENDGILTYETDINFTEDQRDTLSVRVCDNGNGCDTLVVIYKIIDVNDPPVANNDKDTTDYQASVEIDVVFNDTDPDGNEDLDPSTVDVITAPNNGSYDIDPLTGVITYTPNDGFSGQDSFEYTIKDKSGAISNVATVIICVNERPPFVVGGGVTPNGDGKNDYLNIKNIEYYPNTSVQIFNRWGNLVWQQDCCYDNNDPEKRWNGESNVGPNAGGSVPDGSYYFVVDGSADGVNPCTGYAIKN